MYSAGSNNISNTSARTLHQFNYTKIQSHQYLWVNTATLVNYPLQIPHSQGYLAPLDGLEQCAYSGTALKHRWTGVGCWWMVRPEWADGNFSSDIKTDFFGMCAVKFCISIAKLER